MLGLSIYNVNQSLCGYSELQPLENQTPTPVPNVLCKLRGAYQPVYLSNRPCAQTLTSNFLGLDNRNVIPLDSGQFKHIFRTTLCHGNNAKSIAIAIKNPKLSQADQMAFNLERNITIELDSQNIPGVLPLYGVLRDNSNQEVLVSKLCKGNLDQKFDDLLPKFQIEVIRLAWAAVQELHNAGYAHRDIKSSNFLFDLSKSRHIKIYLSDFGLTAKSNTRIQGLKTNFATLDPFSWKNYKEKNVSISDPKSDTWSFGLMICQLMRHGKDDLAIDGDNRFEIESAFGSWTFSGEKINSEMGQRIVNKFLNKTPFDQHKGLKQLVVKMMAYYPQNRPSDEFVSAQLEKIYNKYK